MNKISKEEIAQLPLASFNGRIIVIDTEEEAQKAIAYLKNYSLLGFDTETRPSFKKGKTNKISLIQIAIDDTCFLFRLNKIGFPDFLCDLFSSDKTRIIGLSLKDDFSAIKKRSNIHIINYIELQTYVKQFGIEDSSLQKIYAILFGQKISKSQRLLNWDTDTLSSGQQHYAALDAWACLKIYEKLSKLDITNTK